MKKLFFIFLLLVIPLQASWAAVAAYCQHENEVTVKHLGHHDHKHEHQHAQLDDDEADEPASTAAADNMDCHGVFSGILIGSSETFLSAPITGPPVSETSGLTSTSSPRPEKPKWSSAV